MQYHRTALSAALVLMLTLPQLQGCFPLAAAGAGAAAAAVNSANDTLSLGTQIDDKAIKMRAIDVIRKIPELKNNSNISIMTNNHNILLTGQVRTQALKETISQHMSEIPLARNIYNELAVDDNADLAGYASDTLTTTRVMTGFLGNVNSSQFHVTTERGVVYIMAYTTKEEGEHAAELASQVYGVEKVITAYEHITEETAQQP